MSEGHRTADSIKRGGCHIRQGRAGRELRKTTQHQYESAAIQFGHAIWCLLAVAIQSAVSKEVTAHCEELHDSHKGFHSPVIPVTITVVPTEPGASCISAEPCTKSRRLHQELDSGSEAGEQRATGRGRKSAADHEHLSTVECQSPVRALGEARQRTSSEPETAMMGLTAHFSHRSLSLETISMELGIRKGPFAIHQPGRLDIVWRN